MKLIYPHTFNANGILITSKDNIIIFNGKKDLINKFVCLYYIFYFLYFVLLPIYSFGFYGLLFSIIFLVFNEKRFKDESYLIKLLKAKKSICLK
jgi:hypothetical protein